MRMSPRWAVWERLDIPDPYDPQHDYLNRWRLIQTPWFGIYIHRINTPDPYATLHDHPWNFLLLVLLGGYREMVRYRGPREGRFRDIRWVNRKRATNVHSIASLDRFPTWTLMLVGKRRRMWGYRGIDGTWTPYAEHRHGREFDAAMNERAEWEKEA